MIPCLLRHKQYIYPDVMLTSPQAIILTRVLGSPYHLLRAQPGGKTHELTRQFLISA
jgi:hypothetical protein